MQGLKYSFQVSSIQVEQTEHTKPKLCLAPMKHWAICTWTQRSDSYTLLPGFQSQLYKHDKRAQKVLHQILSVATRFLYLTQSASCFKSKVIKFSGFPGGSPGSDSSPSIIKLLMSDSLAWLISSSDGCLAPQPATYHVEREVNILRTPLGITALGTPRFTWGLTSHRHGFPQDLIMCFITKNERVGGKKGFRSRASPQGTERQKVHTKFLRPSGTTHSLHASSFQAPLLAQLTYISSPYHFFTALGSLDCPHGNFHVSFPFGARQPSLPRQGLYCLPPSRAQPATALTEAITSASPTDKFLYHQQVSPSSGKELLSILSTPPA